MSTELGTDRQTTAINKEDVENMSLCQLSPSSLHFIGNDTMRQTQCSGIAGLETAFTSLNCVGQVRNGVF